MTDFRDSRPSRAEEELGRLEDEPARFEEGRGRGRAASDPKELPKPLYRIKASHSNETFFAFFPTAEMEAAAASPLEAPASTEAPVEAASVEAAPVEAAPVPAEDQPAAEPPAAPVPDAGEPAAAEPADEGPAAAAPVSSAPAGGEPEGAEAPAGPCAGCPRRRGPRRLVVAPTRYGRDLCELQGIVEEPGPIGRDDLVRIERIASADDLRKYEANKERERKAFDLCKQKIAARNLPMKLVAAHYLLEEPKVLFYFSAESRVDFRELVKDLVSVFKMRIELRQIGVRDEARVTGGCGVCGRVLCCHGVTDKLVPVSIKMAKDQNLSLNSMKISGPCGRLLCCLAYEYGFYRDARRELPNEGARFQYDGTLFRVIEVNPLAGKVKMAGEDGRVLDMPAARFAYAEGRWQVREEKE